MAYIVINTFDNEEDVIIISDKENKDVKIKQYDFEHVDTQLQIVEISNKK